MTPLRILICDDELVARKRLARLLSTMTDVQIIGECASGSEALAIARSERPDVLLLDIHMPDLTGLDVLQALDEDAPFVILCTAYSEHALDAFELGAVDYVVKPVELARLRRAIERVLERTKQQAEPDRTSTTGLDRLAIETQNHIALVPFAEIVFAAIEGELTKIVTSDAVFWTTEPLSSLADRLPGNTFERVHRRALLNFMHVERLEAQPTGGLLAHMKSGDRVEVSRQASRVLRRRLGLR